MLYKKVSLKSSEYSQEISMLESLFDKIKTVARLIFYMHT